jgi:hypothetical protein
MTVGDSVGCFLGAALDLAAPAEGWLTVNRTVPGCVLVAPERGRRDGDVEVDPQPACTRGWSSDVRAFAPDLVVVYVGGLITTEYDIGDGEWRRPCDDEFQRWYVEQGSAAVGELHTRGERVAMLNVTSPLDFVDVGVGIEVPSEYREYAACQNEMLSAIAARADAMLIDVDAWTCPDGECIEERDGITLRPDGTHYQSDGANVLARWVVPQLRPLVAPVQR